MDEHRNDYPYNPQASPQFPRPIQGLQQSGYPAPVQRQYQQAYGQSGILGQDAQVLTKGGFKPLSKEEREEAQRIALEAGFSFDGYQVVRREFFSHKYDPALTIKGNSMYLPRYRSSKITQSPPFPVACGITKAFFFQRSVYPNKEKIGSGIPESYQFVIKWREIQAIDRHPAYPQSVDPQWLL